MYGRIKHNFNIMCTNGGFVLPKSIGFFFIEHGVFDNMEIYSNADASNMRKSSKQDRKCTDFWSCFKFHDVKKIVPIK